MDLKDLAMRVRRGVRLLDAKYPRWRSVLKKHRKSFDFKDADHCVLGTLGHHTSAFKATAELDAFNAALKSLTGNTKDQAAERYGFNWQGGSDATDPHDESDALATLWEAELDA